jgi:hypothetical protein
MLTLMNPSLRLLSLMSCADSTGEMSLRFRPCIDLHEGKVKQIVGGSLRDDGSGLRENFVSEKSPAWFAEKIPRRQP